jgi:hypothetical protein
MRQNAALSLIQDIATRTAVRLKNGVSRMLLRVAHERTDVSEELSDSIIRVTRIDELGTTLAITSNRHMLRRNASYG